MALGTPDTKSILILMGAVTVGAVFIIGAALFSTREKEVTYTTAQYQESDSGIIFYAPVEWTVGKSTENFLRIKPTSISNVQTQRSTCTNFSQTTSKAIQTALKNTSSEATTQWKKEYPGLRFSESVQATSGTVLVGIDTCSATLASKTITLRGQAYKNNIEVRFEASVAVDTVNEEETVTNSARTALADALASNTSTTNQDTFNAFVQTMRSIE